MTKFEFTDEEINILLLGLGEIPLKLSFALVHKIKDEHEKQKADKNEIQ